MPPRKTAVEAKEEPVEATEPVVEAVEEVPAEPGLFQAAAYKFPTKQ